MAIRLFSGDFVRTCILGVIPSLLLVGCGEPSVTPEEDLFTWCVAKVTYETDGDSLGHAAEGIIRACATVAFCRTEERQSFDLCKTADGAGRYDYKDILKTPKIEYDETTKQWKKVGYEF